MNKHLKEQDILDYLFGLSAADAAARTGQHLSECPECRSHAEALRRRFNALETLRETESASERLIADTLRRIRTDRPCRETPFPALPWLTGAAAIAALLLAVFWIAPKFGRGPAIQLAKMEAPAGPHAPAAPSPELLGAESVRIPEEPIFGGGTPPSAAMDSDLAGAESVRIPAASLAPSAPDTDYRLEAEQVLADAAGKPPPPMLAASREFAGVARSAAVLNEAPPEALKAAAPAKKTSRPKHAERSRKERPSDEERTIRLPKGWSFTPTQDVRVMLIPLKSKADGLQPSPAEGFRAIYWQIRVLNDAAAARTVSVTRTFELPGWDVQLLNTEGRLAQRSEQAVVIETDVPAGGFRAIHCMISEPLTQETSP